MENNYKKILGLDIGTNSIGWAVIERDFENETGKILGMGSRIIPTDSELLSKYETGQAASKNAGRRQARGARRLKQRYKLRRQRLINSLKILGWLPDRFEPGNQMQISQQTLQEMKIAFGVEEISDDWVVYYLRHKALTNPVSKEELAKILYHMNQRRGFKSNRKAGNEIPQSEEGEESEGGKKKREKKVEIVTIQSVSDTGEKQKGNTVFEITLFDGRKGTIARKLKPNWENQELELEITRIPPTQKNAERFEFRPLSNSDADKWAKQKVAREEAIRKSECLYPGNYYFHELKKNPHYIIKDVSIDRSFYISELTAILQKQLELNSDLNDKAAIHKIAETFYPKNLEKQKELKNNDLKHLFINDIIYFQRPLKSKKSSIADCRFAKKNFIDPSTSKKIAYKAAPVSSPVFQEFRIRQTVNNIKVLQRQYRDENGKLRIEEDVTAKYINIQALEKLYELFDNKEKITQKQILKVIGLDEKEFLINLFRLNEEKELPGNETKSLIRKLFKKASYENEGELLLSDQNKFYLLWHILYSLDEEKHIAKALKNKFGLTDDVASVISKAPAFKQQYGSLSHQAMSRLLPLMKSGKHWNWNNIDKDTKQRLQKIFTGEYDTAISNQVRDLFEKYQIKSENQCLGLSVPMAAYAVYGAHSELSSVTFDSPVQLIPKEPLKLRNPIVEQVVNEALRVVQDIWKTYGRPYEIHIELARDLKKNAKEREEMTKTITENENENKRIAAILRELKIGNPNSISDIERLKLWEKQAESKAREEFKNIKFKRPSEPTKDEIEKYKLWAQQKFLSPYSGDPIPLSKLFTRAYDIDHIIPRSRFFDDSFENKVIVESHLNKEKENMTSYEYIKSGSPKGNGLLSPDKYEAHINQFFFGKKKRLLLSEDVPKTFSNRHLVDSRYISRKLNELLAPVSENSNDPVIPTSGAVTSELKSAWGLGEKMKELIKWRFERLEDKTHENYVWYDDETDQEGKSTGRKILRLNGYEKRLDHRHHAMDALIVACTTRAHIKYLNDLNASQYRKQPTEEEIKQALPKLLEAGKDNYLQSRKFKKPWKGFVAETVSALEGIIISFKKNIRLFGRKANKNLRYVQQPDGIFVKKYLPVINETGQRKLSPYVRASLHKATIAGKISLREYNSVSISEAFNHPELIANKKEKKHLQQILKQANGDFKKAAKLYKENPLKDSNGIALKKVMVIETTPYFVNRVDVTSGFDEKRIEKIPDKVLQKELREHIMHVGQLNQNRSKDEQIDPFGNEGIEILNKNRKFPITKISTKEESSAKFQIRPGAYTEADKGTNLFFVIYQNTQDTTDRQFESIPLRDVIEAKKEGSGFVEDRPGYRWFTISPNDLVYMPDEGENLNTIDWNKKLIAGKIYKMVSCTGREVLFIPQTVSKVIVDKVEFESLNKTGRALDGRMIKQHCIKVQVDRLGNIQPAKKELYNKPSEPANVLSEPEAPYQTGSLKFFSGFDEMENDQLKYFASLQPKDLLQNLKQMVLAAFGFRAETPVSSLPRTIYFNDEP
jgi:CRISPR-associated endonuclease Csn1